MAFRKIHLIYLFWFACSFNLMAQEKHVLNLGQMLEYARENNYEIKEANFNKLQSDEKIREVRGSGLPQISSEIDYKNYLELPKSVIPGAMMGSAEDMTFSFGRKHNMDASIKVSQLLFSLKYINGLKTAKKASEIRELQVEKAQIETIHLLLTEYYNLMAIYKNLEIINSNMESLNQMKERTSSLVRGGLALQTDVDKISINYANLQASKEQVLAAINVQTNNLKYIIGMDTNDMLEVDTTNFFKMFEHMSLTKNTNEELDYSNLNEIKLLEKTLELNKLEIKTKQAEKYPDVALYGSYMFQGIRDEFNFFDTDQDWFDVQLIGVKATIPIFTGFSNNAKIKSAQYKLGITENQKQKALSGLKLNYMNALMQYNSNVKNCQIQQKNIELARNVRHQEQVKYDEGMSTLTDLLITEKDLRNAEIDYTQNFISMKQAEIELLKAQGLLTNYTTQQ